MKALGAMAGLAVAALIFFMVWKFAMPAVTGTKGEGSLDPSLPGNGQTAPRPNDPLSAPQSADEKLRDQYNNQRIPFFRFLNGKFGDLIEKFGTSDEIDTLDLVVTQEETETLQRIISEAVSPSAKEYGFRKVRFFGKRPELPDRRLLIAESTLDETSTWHTFRK